MSLSDPLQLMMFILPLNVQNTVLYPIYFSHGSASCEATFALYRLTKTAVILYISWDYDIRMRVFLIVDSQCGFCGWFFASYMTHNGVKLVK